MSDKGKNIPEGAVRVKNGGWFMPQKLGEPAHSPNVGKKPNVFREAIKQIVENEADFVLMEGFLADSAGGGNKRTNKRVKVWVKMPKVAEIVLEQMKRAKHDVQAARWLSETAYGKPAFTDDEGNELPMIGFKFVVENGGVDEP